MSTSNSEGDLGSKTFISESVNTEDETVKKANGKTDETTNKITTEMSIDNDITNETELNFVTSPISSYTDAELEDIEKLLESSHDELNTASKIKEEEIEKLLESSHDELNTTSKIREIPYQKGLSFINLVKVKRKGYGFYKTCIERHLSTVFKICIKEDRIMICDYKAMNFLFDTDKIEKVTGFGIMDFNPVILRQYTPTMFCNGIEHEQKKAVVTKYLNHCIQNVPLDNLFDVIKLQFEQMPRFQDSKIRLIGKKFDFENVIEKAVANVITYIMFGESIDDLKLLEEWLEKSLESVYAIDLTDVDEERVADKVFERIRYTPNVKRLREIINSTTLDDEHILKEVAWMTIFNAFAGIKDIIISCLICYIRLSVSDQQLVQRDADTFLKSMNYQKTLPTLKVVNAFYLEVLRMFPVAAFIFGRAKKDFTLQSTSGNFAINEKDLLCGNLHISHRDAALFHDPDTFLLNRDVENTKKYNFSFGGKYNTKASVVNHK